MLKLHTIHSKDIGIGKISINPTGELLAASNLNSGDISIWNLNTAEKIHRIVPGDDTISSVTFSPDGTVLAGAGKAGDIKFWKTVNWQLERSLLGHTRRIMEITYSQNGKYLASNSFSDETIRLWSTESNEIITVLPFGLSCAFHPIQHLLAVLREGEISFYESHTGNLTKSETIPDNIEYHLTFSPDGQLIASEGRDGSIYLLRTTGMQVESIIKLPDTARCPTFSPDGQIIAAAYLDSSMIGFWEVKTGLQIAMAKGEFDTPGSLAFTLDGKYIACGSGGFSGGLIEVWQVDIS